MFDSQIFLTRSTSKQRVYILERDIRRFWNPICRPYVCGEAGRREDQERDPSYFMPPERITNDSDGGSHEA